MIPHQPYPAIGRSEWRAALGRAVSTSSTDEPAGGWQPRRSLDDHPDESGPGVRARILGSVFGRSAVVGVLAGLVTFGMISIDYVTWRGAHDESARVVTQRIDTDQRVACGGKPLRPNRNAQVTTFAVARPRAGLPATFTITGCGIDQRPGDVVTVVRVGTGTEDDVMLGPKLTAGYVALFAGTFAALGFGATLVWLTGAALLLPRWHRWVAAGRSRPPAGQP